MSFVAKALIAMIIIPPCSNWDVVTAGEEHVLDCPEGVFTITDAKTPLGIAIDAACEFMDRLREDNIPPFVTSHAELMQFCVGRAWKQQ